MCDCGPQVKPSLIALHAFPQVQGLKCTVAKKPTSKKAEQALRRRARGAIYGLPHTLPLPSRLVPLPIPTLFPFPETRLLSYQAHTVFARHSKFGTFEVPTEFFNTSQKAPAAVAPNEAMGQARRHDTHLAARLAIHMCMCMCLCIAIQSLPVPLCSSVASTVMSR